MDARLVAPVHCRQPLNCAFRWLSGLVSGTMLVACAGEVVGSRAGEALGASSCVDRQGTAEWRPRGLVSCVAHRLRSWVALVLMVMDLLSVAEWGGGGGCCVCCAAPAVVACQTMSYGLLVGGWAPSRGLVRAAPCRDVTWVRVERALVLAAVGLLLVPGRCTGTTLMSQITCGELPRRRQLGAQRGRGWVLRDVWWSVESPGSPSAMSQGFAGQYPRRRSAPSGAPCGQPEDGSIPMSDARFFLLLALFLPLLISLVCTWFMLVCHG